MLVFGLPRSNYQAHLLFDQFRPREVLRCKPQEERDSPDMFCYLTHADSGSSS